MKFALAIFAAAFAVMAYSAICENGEPRDIRFPSMKVCLHQNERHGWEIREDAALFSAHFATVNYDEYHLNYAEQKQLAIAVAKAVAGYYGSTNDIRIVHWEQPEPASTNIGDQISAWLKGDWITDEIVPIDRKDVGSK